MKVRLPWTDRGGRPDALRAAGFATVVGAGIWIGIAFATSHSAVEAFDDAIHRTGDWALYFLLATLAVTPLKRLLAWSRLAVLRRMLGVTACCYAAAHLVLYVVDHGGDIGLVVDEIVARFYLTIGFVALLGLAVLAATSFDAAIRRLRRNWKRVHRLVHPLTVLALTHAFLQSPTDVSEPVLLAGLYGGLLLHRLPASPRLSPAGVPRVLAIALVAGVAAAALEYAWYAMMTGIAAERILSANLDLAFQPRPMWLVMLVLALPLALRPVLRIVRRGSLAAAVPTQFR